MEVATIEDLASLLDNHSQRVEKWFDDEMHRLHCSKIEHLGLHESLMAHVREGLEGLTRHVLHEGHPDPPTGPIVAPAPPPEVSPKLDQMQLPEPPRQVMPPGFMLSQNPANSTVVVTASTRPSSRNASDEVLGTLTSMDENLHTLPHGHVTLDTHRCPTAIEQDELPYLGQCLSHRQNSQQHLQPHLQQHLQQYSQYSQQQQRQQCQQPREQLCVGRGQSKQSMGAVSATSKRSSVSSEATSMSLLYGDERSRCKKKLLPKRKRKIGFGPMMTLDLSKKEVLEEQKSFCPRLTAIVQSNHFKIVCGGGILLNAIFMGIAADIAFNDSLTGRIGHNPTLEHIELGFCAFFLVELLLRAGVEHSNFFKSEEGKWNMFDAFLVLMSLVDVTMNQLQSGQIMNLTFARSIRIVRFVRILRIVRLMRFFYSFRLMVYSVIYSTASLVWVFVLLVFIMYFFSMVFVNVAAEYLHNINENFGPPCETISCQELERLFGGVLNALASLFMSICGGIDWREAWQALHNIHWLYSCVFVFYIFFMMFGVLNVVIATFVEGASMISRQDRELVTQTELNRKTEETNNIRRFFHEADKDNSGGLSWEEFETYLQREHVQAYFQSFQLDVSQAHTLFRLLDVDGSNRVEIDEFVEGCIRMRGQARSIDVHMLLYETEMMIKKNLDFQQLVEKQLQALFFKQTSFDTCTNSCDPASEV